MFLLIDTFVEDYFFGTIKITATIPLISHVSTLEWVTTLRFWIESWVLVLRFTATNFLVYLVRLKRFNISSMTIFDHKRRKGQAKNRGAALVELGICLPVFFLITMASIETCRMIYIRQSLKIAAYESARLGIIPGTTSDTLRSQCDLILLGRNIRGYTFSTVPADPTVLKYGDLFKTSLQIAAKDSAIVGTWFYRDKVFTESVTIMAEY